MVRPREIGSSGSLPMAQLRSIQNAGATRQPALCIIEDAGLRYPLNWIALNLVQPILAAEKDLRSRTALEERQCGLA